MQFLKNFLKSLSEILNISLAGKNCFLGISRKSQQKLLYWLLKKPKPNAKQNKKRKHKSTRF